MTAGKAVEGILIPPFGIVFGISMEPSVYREALSAGSGGVERCGKDYRTSLERSAGESPEGHRSDHVGESSYALTKNIADVEVHA